MPTCPLRLIFNACSYVNPSWTFLNPHRLNALYSRHSILFWNIMTPNHSRGFAGASRSLCCELLRTWTGPYSIPSTQRARTHKVDLSRPVNLRVEVGMFLFFLPFSWRILTLSFRSWLTLRFLQEVTADYTSLAVPDT